MPTAKTHSELMARQGIYAEMFTKQSELYKDIDSVTAGAGL
ncbi:MAG: hypothetical protein PUA83_03605 [Clostridiales bacterium]|nr:hypothetical protein [Clostridiales bacterium]